MAGIPAKAARQINDYPTTDGKPMAETDWHRDLMATLIQTLEAYYASDPRVYVSGNLLVFYEPGNRRRHVSPDVFVVKGVEKRQRPNYLIWDEGKGPEVVIELTSRTTREEDIEDKYELYQRLNVSEYFLFDPLGDYMRPQLDGYRMQRAGYKAIRPVDGRLPSKVLRLHLEGDGRDLRLYDPTAGAWLPTPLERVVRAEEARREAETARRQAEAEADRLRRELEDLRRRTKSK